jgi:uncharacterized protein YndB with AHSA1/START domain
MAENHENESSSGTDSTSVARASDRELVVTRTFKGPARIVYAAWTTPDLFRRWWAPKSFGITILSCEMDVQTGGTYRLEMGHASSDKTMVFFGRYLEVIPNSKIVWTNDEGEETGAITTVTFEDHGGETRVVLRDLYPSKKALDDAAASQATSGFGEQFAQLDALLAS